MNETSRDGSSKCETLTLQLNTIVVQLLTKNLGFIILK